MIPWAPISPAFFLSPRNSLLFATAAAMALMVSAARMADAMERSWGLR